MQVADAELAQVRQPLAHAPQRAGEAVDVGDVAHGLLALQPVRGDLALVVERARLGSRAAAAVRAIASSSRAPLRREARVVAVERDERVAQLGEEALQPRGKAASPSSWASARS